MDYYGGSKIARILHALQNHCIVFVKEEPEAPEVRKPAKGLERTDTEREFQETRLGRELEARRKTKQEASGIVNESFEHDSLPSILPDNDDVFFGNHQQSFRSFGHGRNQHATPRSEYMTPTAVTAPPAIPAFTDPVPRKSSVKRKAGEDFGVKNSTAVIQPNARPVRIRHYEYLMDDQETNKSRF